MNARSRCAGRALIVYISYLLQCDQLQPICTPCSKGSRPCRYIALQKHASTRTSHAFSGHSAASNATATDCKSVLKLKSCRHAENGPGVFRIFSAASKPITLSNGTTRLIPKWERMLTVMPDGWKAEAMQCRFGCDLTFDAAADYMCDCFNFFMVRSESCYDKTRQSGAKAVTTLRATISKGNNDLSESIIFAVRILLRAEVRFAGFYAEVLIVSVSSWTSCQRFPIPRSRPQSYAKGEILSR